MVAEVMIKIKEREVTFTAGYIRRQSCLLPEAPVSVGLVDGGGGGGGAGPVLLDVVLGQEDPVLQVGQGGTEVVVLVGLPPGVQPVTLGYAAVNVHTETNQILEYILPSSPVLPSTAQYQVPSTTQIS